MIKYFSLLISIQCFCFGRDLSENIGLEVVCPVTYHGELAFVVKVVNTSEGIESFSPDVIDEIFCNTVLVKISDNGKDGDNWANVSITPEKSDSSTLVTLGPKKFIPLVVYAPPSALLRISDFDEKVRLSHKKLSGSLIFSLARKNGGEVVAKKISR